MDRWQDDSVDNWDSPGYYTNPNNNNSSNDDLFDDDDHVLEGDGWISDSGDTEDDDNFGENCIKTILEMPVML